LLKGIRVELSSYHDGSFNGMDIKKVMNNATYPFDTFTVFFYEGKREGCLSSDTDNRVMCLHIKEVYICGMEHFY
jgi:hypothetical protein